MNIICRRREKVREDGERDGIFFINILDILVLMIFGLVSFVVLLCLVVLFFVLGLFLFIGSVCDVDNGFFVDVNMKFDDFLRKYISEDNVSFFKILEKVNK